MKIEGDMMKEYLVKENILTRERIDFMKVYEGFVAHALKIRTDHNYWPAERYLEAEKSEFKINKIKMVVESGQHRKFFINKRKIHITEVEPICLNAIHFRTQAEYNKYLDFTQKYSLLLQHYLKQGELTFQAPNIEAKNEDDYENSKIRVIVPLKMKEDGKIYATIKGQDYKLRNQFSLLKLARENYFSRYAYNDNGRGTEVLVNQLHNSFSDLTATAIINLIKDGMIAYRKYLAEEKKLLQEKIRNSEEFLAHAIRLSEAQKVENVRGETNEQWKGYLVKGLSGTIYFVNEKDFKVYICKENKKGHWKSEKYLCIIDIGTNTSTPYGKNDAIAKRLIALNQDKKVAGEIFKHGDHLDRWWLELSSAGAEVADESE